MLQNAALRFRDRRGGFVLITVALSAVLLIGVLGLCLDLGRLYVARNELQAYVDSATIAAAFHLNNTQQGITDATNVAKAYPNNWNFQTAKVENVTVGFSPDPGGPYVANPTNPKGVKYVHVRAEGTVVLYFLPGFSEYNVPAAFLLTIARQLRIQRPATSGQFIVNGLTENLLPYSPGQST